MDINTAYWILSSIAQGVFALLAIVVAFMVFYLQHWIKEKDNISKKIKSEAFETFIKGAIPKKDKKLRKLREWMEKVKKEDYPTVSINKSKRECLIFFITNSIVITYSLIAMSIIPNIQKETDLVVLVYLAILGVLGVLVILCRVINFFHREILYGRESFLDRCLKEFKEKNNSKE